MGALVSSQGRVLKVIEWPTLKRRRALTGQLFDMIETLRASAPAGVMGIGVGAPAAIDMAKGLMARAPNFPDCDGLPLQAILSKRFGLPVVLDNDANAAALAEALWGAGKRHDNVFYATISTGIGSGFVMRGQLYHGRTGAAFEAGHLSIDYRGRHCQCGLRGCIEAYASGPSIVRRAREAISGLSRGTTAKDLERLLMKGHRQVLKLVEETGQYLGIWLGNIINILEPDIIVLGGGVTFFGKPLFDSIKKTFPAYSINPKAREIPIVSAKLKRHVGVLGAAAVFLRATKSVRL